MMIWRIGGPKSAGRNNSTENGSNRGQRFRSTIGASTMKTRTDCPCPPWWSCDTRGCYLDALERYAEAIREPEPRTSQDLTPWGEPLQRGERMVAEQYAARPGKR